MQNITYYMYQISVFSTHNLITIEIYSVRDTLNIKTIPHIMLQNCKETMPPFVLFKSFTISKFIQNSLSLLILIGIVVYIQNTKRLFIVMLIHAIGGIHFSTFLVCLGMLIFIRTRITMYNQRISTSLIN